MKLSPTKIPDVLLIEPQLHIDIRGFFYETYQHQRYYDAGIKYQFVQDNYVKSAQGVLRGLHYQMKNAQGKLIWVVLGEVFDVVVDLRRDSITFGQYESNILSANDRIQKWVPPGFAHGYYVLSENAEIFYKTTDYYAPQWERVILWNDPVLNIQWPLIEGQQPLISKKDSTGTIFSESELPLM
jgi:dTDP-4-dehydrorhamnose 3,5-epimerase